MSLPLARRHLNTSSESFLYEISPSLTFRFLVTSTVAMLNCHPCSRITVTILETVEISILLHATKYMWVL